MKNRFLKRCVPLLTALGLLPLTGCSGTSIFSNFRRVEDLDLVRTICVDSAGGDANAKGGNAEGVNVLVCASIGGDQPKIRMYERQGPSLATTLGQLQTTSVGKRMDLSHTKNFVIGEEQAKLGIVECLDYVVRYGEIQLNTNLFIVRGEARELMQGLAGEESSPAEVLNSLVDKFPHQGEGFVYSCGDVAVDLAGNGCALVMAIEAVPEEKLFDSRGDCRAAPVGFALLVDGKLKDYLTPEETLGVLLLKSELKAVSADLECDGSLLTVEVSRVDTTLEPVFKNDDLTGFRCRLKVDANVVNMDASASQSDGANLEDKAFREKAEKELAALMVRCADAAFQKSLASGEDFLNLSDIAWRAKPTVFRKKEFKERFRELKLDLSCDAELMRTYDVTNPLTENGEEEPEWWQKVIRSLKGS